MLPSEPSFRDLLDELETTLGEALPLVEFERVKPGDPAQQRQQRRAMRQQRKQKRGQSLQRQARTKMAKTGKSHVKIGRRHYFKRS